MRTPVAVGHLDADCFYVSAERVRDSFLIKKPVGVLGNQGACVIAKSYEMKAAGVKTGEPIWEARAKCPDGVYVKRDFRWYEVLSRGMLDVVREVSPRVEYHSIDEFFFLAAALLRGVVDGRSLWYNPGMSQTPKKFAYRVTNWKDYNKALVRRGSLTVWIDRQALDAWHHQGPARRGARFTYSDPAIQCLLTLRAVFHLPLRATRGMARSIFDLMGLALEVPHYSTPCRRAATARIDLPGHAEGPVHLVIDSTGMKVFGEGEWKVRQHGYSKRRTWRKLHLAIDPESHEILGAMVTEPCVTDAEVVPDLPGQVDRPVVTVGADGAYDQEEVDRAVAGGGAVPVIPPRKHAKVKIHGNTKGEPHPRDTNLRAIRRPGRAGWKRESGYHRRSLAETAMGRIKGIFGGVLRSREWLRQGSESGTCCRALNIMTHLGMPVSVKIA